MNTIYKKEGKRYYPIGAEYDKNWLNDGVWIVRNKGCNITRADYAIEKLCMIPEATIVEAASMQEYVDYAHDKLFNMIREDKQYSTDDLINMVVGAVFELSNRKRGK